MAGSDIPDTACRKTRRRRTQTITEHQAFHANAKRRRLCRTLSKALDMSNNTDHTSSQSLKDLQM